MGDLPEILKQLGDIWVSLTTSFKRRNSTSSFSACPSAGKKSKWPIYLFKIFIGRTIHDQLIAIVALTWESKLCKTWHLYMKTKHNKNNSFDSFQAKNNKKSFQQITKHYFIELFRAFHGQISRNCPVGNHMLKVDNRNTRTRREICSKLTIKTPEQRHCLYY